MQTDLEQRKLLTVQETQELLSIGRTRLFQLIASGRLKSVKIGSSRRIPISAVDEFIEELCDASGLWSSKEEPTTKTV